MREYTFQELRAKKVVNIAQGKYLGHICDLAFTCTGQVCGLFVPNRKGVLRTMASPEAVFIPWQNVIKIGSDVILIELVGGVGVMNSTIETLGKPEEQKEEEK